MQNLETPEFPYLEGPRDYQQEAFHAWTQNEMKGFFAMATGTGKTITALNCLLELYRQEGSYKCLILVPTISLIEQWARECARFNFNRIVKISSEERRWKDDLMSIVTGCYCNEAIVSYVVICSYASFVKSETFGRLEDLPDRTLLIADEAHNIGAPLLLRAIQRLNLSRKIGLSATPHRQYDKLGNNVINNFFNVKEKYTFEYPMSLAIDNGVLCHYLYYPHIVRLNEDEMEQYLVLSRQIAKFYNAESDDFTENPILTALLLKRKRIIHKAYNKLNTFRHIISLLLKKNGNLDYTMVYVPEGYCPDSSYCQDIITTEDHDYIADEEDIPLIDLYTHIVSSANQFITVEQFTSKESDREAILNRFTNGKTQVLVAMKCLDEGVDIPRAENAIFCASTGNPRQFVQRRGRILRAHPDKPYAFIHDMVVVPFVDYNFESFRMERSLLERELKRVSDFSSLASNSSYTEDVLEDIIEYYDLNLCDDEQNRQYI